MHAEANQTQRCSSPEAKPGAFLTPPTSPATSRVVRLERQEKTPSLARSDLVPRTPPASPQKGQSSEGDEKNRANQHWSSILESLNDRWGVHKGQCGALTKMNMRCGQGVRSRKFQLNKLISSMANMPADPDNKLNELVSLTLCKAHQKQTSSRLGEMLDSCPTGSGMEQTRWFIATRIKNIVPKACTECLADGHVHDSRDSKIGGRNVQIIQEILWKVTTPYIYSDDTRLQAHLEVLGQCVFCPLHRDKEKPTSVREWMSNIQAIHPPIKLAQSISTAPAVAKIASPKQLIRDDIPTLASIEQIGYDTSPFTVVERCSPNFVKCTQAALKSRSGSPEGYVYAYKVKGNSGFVKIGYTGFTSQTRFKDIAFTCNRKPMELYPTSTDTDNKIKNPKVVEALCHAQLREHQVTIDCDACLSNHREWFCVASEDAIGAIQKWSSWMEKFTAEPNWRQKLDDKIEKMKDLGRLLKELEGETL